MQERHLPHVLCFLLVVQLLEQPVTHLVPERIEIDAHEHADQRAEERLEVLQVCAHDVVDVGVLHLHGNRASIVENTAVNLADGRSSERLTFEGAEQLIRIRQLGLNLPVHGLKRHPGC